MIRRLILAGAVLASPIVLAGRAAAADPVRVVRVPKVVTYDSSPMVHGRVTRGLAEYLVAVERHTESGWQRLATGTPKRGGRVKILLPKVQKSATYRLVTRMPGVHQTSSSFRIRVRGQIQVDVSPTQLMRGDSVQVSGSVVPSGAQGKVLIRQIAGGKTRRLGRADISDGRFSTSVTPRLAGAGVLSVSFSGGLGFAGESQVKLLTVYRPAEATWYGPGFFGQWTACGQIYTDEIMGVAHRSLPCGTYVTLFFAGNVVSVPVIDRGPYSSADWDLSAATARALGFDGRQTIGVLKAAKPGE